MSLKKNTGTVKKVNTNLFNRMVDGVKGGFRNIKSKADAVKFVTQQRTHVARLLVTCDQYEIYLLSIYQYLQDKYKIDKFEMDINGKKEKVNILDEIKDIYKLREQRKEAKEHFEMLNE